MMISMVLLALHFAQLPSGAAMSDKISCGATQAIHLKLCYDDAVNYSSRAYAAGEIAGEIVSQVVQNLTPCGQALKIRYAIKALHAAQAAGNTIGAAEAASQGDVIGALTLLSAAKGSVSQMMKNCFVAGTPMKLADGGSQPIELMKGYDEYGDDCDIVLCRDDKDPTGPLLKKRVLQTFTRVSPILNVKVRNRIIGTTGEHPFYARGKGWITASELQFGDRLLTSEGEWIGCEGIEDTGRVETVYNFEVEDSHTYFVGEKEWGFDVWVHNAPNYVGSAKHAEKARHTPKGVANPAPRNPKAILDSSVQIKPTSPRRIGVDRVNQEIGILDRTGGEVFHGHVRNWSELTTDMKNALIKAGLANAKGKIL